MEEGRREEEQKRIDFFWKLRYNVMAVQDRAKVRGYGGIGRRARFRSVWEQSHEGSSPFFCRNKNRCISYELGDTAIFLLVMPAKESSGGGSFGFERTFPVDFEIAVCFSFIDIRRSQRRDRISTVIFPEDIRNAGENTGLKLSYVNRQRKKRLRE